MKRFVSLLSLLAFVAVASPAAHAGFMGRTLSKARVAIAATKASRYSHVFWSIDIKPADKNGESYVVAKPRGVAKDCTSAFTGTIAPKSKTRKHRVEGAYWLMTEGI
jgi:hypothetical protein